MYENQKQYVTNVNKCNKGWKVNGKKKNTKIDEYICFGSLCIRHQ
jgi:uncharacterized C2H2 Zn-finger protein